MFYLSGFFKTKKALTLSYDRPNILLPKYKNVMVNLAAPKSFLTRKGTILFVFYCDLFEMSIVPFEDAYRCAGMSMVLHLLEVRT